MADFLERPRGTEYFLTRALLLRSLGAIYAVAFVILIRQAQPLLGSHGLLPLAAYMDFVLRHFDSQLGAVWRMPTLFWLGSSDALIEAGSWIGLMLATLVVCGVANAPILAALWALYLSFVPAGQIFYGYGWDILLCEAGFLAVFLAPPWRPNLLSARDPPPLVVIVLFRWLTFRLMFGAGLIKIRGDACWTELTCLDFHYETQPNPSPLSPYFHFAPHFTHTAGVLFNHLAELVAPFGVFGPRRVRHVAGLVIVGFQALLILSGNLSFLNWLSIVIALACFDDRLFARLAPARLRAELPRLRETALAPSRARLVTLVALGIVIGFLSLNPIVNLLSPRQAMNASFDPFGLVNTYGAFGSVTRERHEVAIEGTVSPIPDESADWREYEFPCKPGDVRRSPCLVTPYHYRLDWQLWFAGLSNLRREPWIMHLAYKLLEG
ncbi:MAG TPA: lipase maturation factor family protein, partial [Polyangiaceae bacterium]